MRKNVLIAVIHLSLSTRKLRMIFRSGKVAEQRVRQLQRVGKGLLRERVVGANAEDLDTEGFEALVVGLPGRQVRGSGWNKSRAVELKEDPLLAPEVIEGNV